MSLVRIVLLFITTLSLYSQTIEDKLDACKHTSSESCQSELKKIHEELKKIKCELHQKTAQACLCFKNGDEEGAKKLLDEEISPLKKRLFSAEENWHAASTKSCDMNLEEFAPFDLQNASVGKLLIEYGSCEYLYVVPPEVMKMQLQMHTNLLISKHSWAHLLEKILHHNGIGVKSVNPFTKQLFLIKSDVMSVEGIISSLSSLKSCPEDMHIMFIYEPLAENLKGSFYLLDRFRDQNTTFVYQSGSKIICVGSACDVKNLFLMANKVFNEGDEKVTKVISSSKLNAEEMTKILRSFFGSINTHSASLMLKGTTDLVVLPLAQEACVVLIGAKNLVKRAETILKHTENQLEDPHQMTIFWYTCRHSTPEDMAEVLDKVYQSLLISNIESHEKKSDRLNFESPNYMAHHSMNHGGPSMNPYSDRYALPASPKNDSKQVAKQVNFIPYPMTGSLLMVVRKDILSRIKGLVERLDTPKKMVEIEILLCERRVNHSNRSGLNFLKMGSNASQQRVLDFNYDNTKGTADMGVMKFLCSLPKTDHAPAFDLAYNFLMSQEDVKVTASPSITTLNQTPANFSITDEISINMGAAPIDSNKGVVFEKSFSRSQFGITIDLTPTIHEPDQDDCYYITLENDINFDTIKSDRDDKPNVHKRHIKNQVRIADGQTVVLGGLKSKAQEDSSEKIPFLGEIPGFGKLFGSSTLNDKASEMFIFITPRVIRDAKTDLIKRREQIFGLRPSDHKLLMKKIHESQSRIKACFMQKSFETVFGRVSNVTKNF